MNNIPVFKPLIQKEEINAVVKSLEVGWLGMGSNVKEFESQIAKVCNLNASLDKYVVAVSTGHAAIHLALMTIGVGFGDEVITPSFNNVADFQAIKACGASPVFVDIEKETLCIDHNKIEEAITSKTKCIIVMDYDICLCNHDEIRKIADKHNIPILHDAAHSFGSFYKGIPIGNQHDYTIFSFDPVKTITSIDGGAIIIKGIDHLKRLQAIRLIGMTQPAEQMYQNSRAWTYDVEELGYRYHLSNVHAAFGVEQIKKINNIRESRQKTCLDYYNRLKTLHWLYAPYTNFEYINPFLYYIRILNGQRDELREHMKNFGVDTGIHWQPGHTFSYFKNCLRKSLDITETISKQILSLPLHSLMCRDDSNRVIESILDYDKNLL